MQFVVLLWVFANNPGILINLFHMFPIKKEKYQWCIIIVYAVLLSIFPQ